MGFVETDWPVVESTALYGRSENGSSGRGTAAAIRAAYMARVPRIQHRRRKLAGAGPDSRPRVADGSQYFDDQPWFTDELTVGGDRSRISHGTGICGRHGAHVRLRRSHGAPRKRPAIQLVRHAHARSGEATLHLRRGQRQPRLRALDRKTGLPGLGARADFSSGTMAWITGSYRRDRGNPEVRKRGRLADRHDSGPASTRECPRRLASRMVRGADGLRT